MKPSEILLGIAAGLVGALGLDLFGVTALIVVTLLLVLGIAFRAQVAVIASAIACAVTIVLWVLAVMRCDPAIQDCSVEGPLLVVFVWLGLVVVVGVAATLRLAPRSRPR